MAASGLEAATRMPYGLQFSFTIPVFLPAIDSLKYIIYHIDKLIHTMYVNVDTSLSVLIFPEV